MTRTVFSLAAVCLFLFPCGASAGLMTVAMIDDGRVGATTVTADTSNGNVSQLQQLLDPDSVLLGKRQITIQGDLASGSLDAVVDTSGAGRIRYIPNSPVFNVSSVTGTSFDGRLILFYLPGDRFTTFDLTSLGGDAIAIDVLSASFGADSSLTGKLGVNGFSGVDFTMLASATPYTIVVPLSDLSDLGADLTSAFNLKFDFSLIPPAGTFDIDNIRLVSTTTPEPSSLLLFGAGAFGLLGFGRRRKAVSA